MREVALADLAALVSRLYQEANFRLPADVINALELALNREDSPLGRDVLQTLLENAQLAGDKRLPLCQDTGIAFVLVEVGQEVHFTGGTLKEAVDEGIASAVREGHLRASVVAGPCLDRTNTSDNTPAVLHVDLVAGDEVKVWVLPKGAGSENMSRVAMLKPAAGTEGVIDFITTAVFDAGANPCPPVFLGVGIGGTMDKAVELSKRALLRPAGQPHPDPRLATLEADIFERVNALGIGPGGFGGRVTCLGAAVEDYPCHIASLPVAVNIQCNSARRASGSL